jgi:cyanophycin synthetase
MLVIDGELIAATVRRAPDQAGELQQRPSNSIACLAKNRGRSDEPPSNTPSDQLIFHEQPQMEVVFADVTEEVHPDNRRLAVRAAKALDLYMADVELVTPDIRRPWHEVGGKICGVKPQAGFQRHAQAMTNRLLVPKVMKRLFPEGKPRGPIAAITGTNGKTTTTRMLSVILKKAGYRVGNATTDGVVIDGELVRAGDMAGPPGALTVLDDPTIDAAVLETARGGILLRGVAFDRCNVSAVLNVDRDHLGQHGVDTLDGLAKVKRRVALAARDAVILNADDPHCRAMVKHVNRAEIVLVSLNERSKMIKFHTEMGGRALVEAQRKGRSVLLTMNGPRKSTLMAVDEIPATWNGRAVHNVFNALAAAAMAQELGVQKNAIRDGLKSFESSLTLSSGRLNYIPGSRFNLLLDQAHNVPGIGRFVQFFDEFPVAGRRILVLTLSGRKSDDQIRDCVAPLVGRFDQYVTYERPDWIAEREAGEIAQMLRSALVEKGVPKSRVKTAVELSDASAIAVKIAKPRDLVVVFGSVTTGDSRNNMKKTLELFNGV